MRASPPPMDSPSLHKTSSRGQETTPPISSQLCAQLLFLPSLILTLTPQKLLVWPLCPFALSYYPISEGGLMGTL